MHPNVAKARSRKANAHKRGDAAAITEAGRDLAMAKLQAFIERELKNAPPLTDSQRADIAAMFAGGDAG